MGILSNTILYGNTRANTVDFSNTLTISGQVYTSTNYLPGTAEVVYNGLINNNTTSSGFMLGVCSSTGGQTKPNYLKSTANISSGVIIASGFSGTVTNANSIGGKTSTNIALCPDRINWWKSTSNFSRSLNSTGSINASYFYLMNIVNTNESSSFDSSIAMKAASSIPISGPYVAGGIVPGGGTLGGYYTGTDEIDYISGMKKGDLLFDNNGAIATVTNITYTACTLSQHPSVVYYRVCWLSSAAWTCLEEGTMITMADWSQKPIEEVLPGELVMGYDFEKNEPTPSVVLTCDATENNDMTNYFIFENGDYLSCTEDHEIYSETKKCHIFARDMEEGEKCLDQNGNEIEIYAIHKSIYTFEFRQFYQLVTSNNTYFANGILNAMGPGNKRNWLIAKHGDDIPEEIEEIFKLDGAEYHVYEFLGENEEFRKKSLDVMENLKIRGNKIASLKQYLKDTDYIAAKKSEGQEVDENILTQRQKNRDEINKLEEELNTIYWPEHNRLLSENSELGDDILLSNEERRSKYFFEACKRDNENFELFKKYYAYK